MKRLLRRQLAIICAALLFASPAVAQDNPNLLMNEAISRYTMAMSANGEERFQLLKEVDGLLTRIETEFPGSAPASLMQMGIPLGPIDQTTLEAELTASEPQLADRLSGELAEQWRLLQERSPDVASTVEQTLKEISGSVVDEAKEEAYVKTTYIVMSTYYYLGGTALFEYFDAEEAASVYKAFVTGRGLDRALADIGKSTGTDIAMGVALDFATSTITDFLIERAPEMQPATQTLVRAGLKATLAEVALAVQAYKDPTKVPGLGIKRVADLIEIIVTTRGLAADVDRALAETAHRMRTMAQLTASYRDQENVQKIITDTRRNLVSDIEGAVGKDDAKAVSDIMLLGWAALVAEFEGDTDQAEALHGLLIARGSIDNMPTIWNAPDLAVYFANGFTDSPKRAAEIMIGLTELSKYSKNPEPMEMVTTPSTSPELADTQVAPDGFLGPDVSTPIDAAYIRRAKDRFHETFAQMCALPSVQEAGLPCPFVAPSCEGEGCIARGPMQALEAVELVAAPGDSRVVSRLQPGDWVFSELARVWLAPCRSRVSSSRQDSGPLPPVGTVVWRTSYVGEGFSNYFQNGGPQTQFFDDYLTEESEATSEADDPCFHQNRQNWLLMRTEDGLRGWAPAQAHFKGKGYFSGDDMSDVPQWALDYPMRSPDISGSDDPFELVLENAALPPGAPSVASCSSSDSLLSKDEILSLLAGNSSGTRPGQNRYTIQEWSDYDYATDSGVVTLSSDYQGTWESVDIRYMVRGSEICNQSMSGGNINCEEVRICDWDGRGPELVFFADGQVSTTIDDIDVSQFSKQARSESALKAPDGYKWFQLASRSDLASARQAAQELTREGDGPRIFETTSSWYAIALSPVAIVGPEDELAENIRSNWQYPSDSFLTDGDSYIRELALIEGGEVFPAFTWTTTNQDTTLFTRDYRTGEKTHINVASAQIAKGSRVLIWGQPDKQYGHCLADGHEGIFMECAHTVAFASLEAPSDGPRASFTDGEKPYSTGPQGVCTKSVRAAFPQDWMSATLTGQTVLNGQTVSGKNWQLRLWRPGSSFGGADFTNSEGTTTEGLWYPESDGLCQSYDGRQGWVCYQVHACTNNPQLYTFTNQDGDVTSYVAEFRSTLSDSLSSPRPSAEKAFTELAAPSTPLANINTRDLEREILSCGRIHQVFPRIKCLKDINID